MTSRTVVRLREGIVREGGGAARQCALLQAGTEQTPHADCRRCRLRRPRTRALQQSRTSIASVFDGTILE